MSREKEAIQLRRNEDGKNIDSRKNRISFKQFQQSYEQHVETQKQKRKIQQESLNKLSLKNAKTLNEINKQNESHQSNEMKETLNKNINNQNNIKLQSSIQKTENEPISFNRTVNIKSCYTSPKASSINFIKPMNLASNKSKQIIIPQKITSNTKVNRQTTPAQPKRNNVSINLNLKPNTVLKNQLTKQSKEQPSQQIAKFQSNQLSKNSSLSQMKSFDFFDGSLTSVDSQKFFINSQKPPQYLEQSNLFTQQVSYLAQQLQFLNQFFKQIQPQQQNTQASTNPNLTYKVKLLSQIKNKLNKFGQNSIKESNPLKHLFSNIINLLQNYENDLKRFSIIPSLQNPKPKALQIMISQPEGENFENRFKRQDSKKRTVKLSKSRRTNQETLYTESITHPFESSELSILNSSKITDNSRPSSQNKDKSAYFNEIENIINSKILHQSVDKKQKGPQNNSKKDQNQSKMKVLIKSSSKVMSNLPSSKGIPIKGLENKTHHLSQQPQTKNKVKSVTKIINLVTSPKIETVNRPPLHKQISINATENSKSITMKDILQKNKQKNMSQQQNIFEKISTNPCFQQNKNNFLLDKRQSMGSHNESIFQLQYLENYSSQNHNLNQKNKAEAYNFSKLSIEAVNNINWKQNKYGNKLFT